MALKHSCGSTATLKRLGVEGYQLVRCLPSAAIDKAHGGLLPCEIGDLAMLLYKYLGSHTLETLQTRRLKASRVKSFNDPFDCQYRGDGVMTLEKTKRYLMNDKRDPDLLVKVARSYNPAIKDPKRAKRFIKKNLTQLAQKYLADWPRVSHGNRGDWEQLLDDSFRLICFCSAEAAPDELLMWSHYGRSHEGARIGFEFPTLNNGNFYIKEVTYSGERVVFDFTDIDNDEAMKAAITACLKTKGLSWAYECEYRLITNPSKCVRNGVLDFLPFDASWVTRVDLGARHDPGISKEIGDLLARDFPNAKCYAARYHPTMYALEYSEMV